MRSLLSLLLLVLLAHAAAAQPGAVLLQDAAGHTVSIHASIQQAYDAIPATLTQPYTIAIDSTYRGRTPDEHFPIRLTPKGGTSAAHTITIRANRRDYWLTRFTLHTDSTELMVFDGASWVIVDGERATPDEEFPNGLSFRGNASAPQTEAPVTYPLIRFVNGASHNTIRYCELSNGRRQPGPGNEAAVLFDTSAAASGNNDNLIEHCLFDTENGLRSKGSAARPNTRNAIRSNLFDQAYVNALTVQEGTGALTFANNTVYSGTSFTSSSLSSAVHLIRVASLSDTLLITGNALWLGRPGDGSSPDSALNAVLIAPSGPAAAGSYCIIANNYIANATAYFRTHNTVAGPYWEDAAPGPLTAIELRTGGAAADVLIAHNTVRLGSAASADSTRILYSAALRRQGSGGGGRLQVLNNIFDNLRQGGGPGTHHLVLDLQDTTGAILDYNIYHTAGMLAAIDGQTYRSLNGYRAALSAQEQHSSDSAVIFEGIGTCLLSAAMAGRPFMAGISLPEVAEDKNGYPRTLPYRGAEELTANCDTSNAQLLVSNLSGAACTGKQVYLQYTERSWLAPVLPAGGRFHQWQAWAGNAGGFSDITGAHTTDLVVTQTQTTTYRVKDSCVISGLVTYSNQVTVPMKIATAVLDSITASNDGGPQIIRYEVHASSPATSYTWYFGDGMVDFSSTNSIDHYYSTPGIYTVTVYTDNECSEPVSRTIDTRIPQAIGGPQLGGNGLKAYPNPAAHQLQVQSAGPLGRLTVTDLLGRTLRSQVVTGNNTTLSVTGLPAGSYLLRSGSGQVARFTVQH